MDFPRKQATPLWSPRGVLQTMAGLAGWLLLIPVWWLAQTPLLTGSLVGWLISLAGVVFAVLVSTVAALIAGVRRSWGIALMSLALAATFVVVAVRQDSELSTVDQRYRSHRAALADLAEDYRAGRLDGDLTLPRSLCPSGFAYASPTILFVQTWQNWRAESGTGFGYFAGPPVTTINTASGDTGKPLRELGDGWWWVA